ncbi:TPA: protein translocase subunit SecF [Candidatus Berkelbacteria bacterium]|uniref:Protein-export membrane protein SecF n=1 Tax=Berkelbacteria bacterium GW2011_GWE1_39_12 TaxID=1618337 RepID=A0A0G4B4D2_9BACT|nr:MAG: protein-export membrane protein SecF, preprotein translocase subunit SecF [Berkelbacteria bacterium GW2011_GWE1_39_12]HBO60100.1 protein translocase subunit SecF [Candidatus Berkelbacteria bacterium]
MNIIGRRKIWYIVSTVLIAPGIIALILWGLKFGIDFKGGALIQVQYSQSKPVDEVKNSLKDLGLNNLIVTTTSDNGFIIRTETLTQEQYNKISDQLKKVGEYKETSYESVGPTVSSDIEKKAIISVILASLAIILFVAYTFRRVPKPASSWRFGICAVLALIHDLAFVIGLFAILGHFLGYEIDSLFITALLTIMGFSVHDTIVVFDRIRENLRKHPSENFEKNVNNSIIQTLNRSLNTSLTVLIVLAALFFLGGVTLHHFVLALLAGIAIGTYSSIFNASAMLVSWQGWSMRRLAKEKVT